MSDTAEKATEIVAEVAEEMAEQATHVAEVSRGLSGRNLGLAFGGFVVGAGLGGTLGFIFCRRKLETKYSQLAAEEIAEMREHYNSKVVAFESQAGKADLEEIVRERGYSSEAPMAVTPPAAVTEAAAEAEEDETPTESSQEVLERLDAEENAAAVKEHNVFRDTPPPEDDWDYAKERAQRSPLRPYVIHRDEREDQDAYDDVTWTYYEEDDVLCRENDEIIDKAEREQIIGEANLAKFGHGSGDATVVYVRNDKLEVDFEIVRSPNSFAEEVHGFEPQIKHSDRRERTRFDDE